ncbi:MAG: hypothetical protein BGN95_11415 [Sphingomonas sp. 66-10]|jgi:osmotically-inducible protein OsmY|uniref:BON domain-containing protein n=1 Tax=Sphingomonas sp. 66-10 TaxID=1895848 RepID=UPI000925A3C9|nr:BON domain-containing protein [Sphingomonas sp. 66-10]OJU21224.1 MAG: hypothetical protein BGN95_11415 [Sphingomonas sp. 66-10]
MHDDAQSLRNVRNELDGDPTVDHTAVHAVVQDGVAVLSGTVTNYAAKLAAEKAARRASGVCGVFDGIVVSNDPDATDEAVLERVYKMLELDANVPSHTLTATIEHGRVTLSGNVEWEYQREAARTAAARVRGVTGVNILVHVNGMPSIIDIRGRVVIALQQAAEAEAERILIDIDGSTVRLAGQLASAREREVAVAAVRSAPGVTRVEDCIELG